MPKIGEVTRYALYNEDCRDVMKRLVESSVDSIVTDPPYGLKFMGNDWDHGVPGAEFWRLVLRVAKPSSYMVAFGGTRTFHRLAVAIEDAGWEIRDCLSWLYGTGFPKGRACLKPAWEPIILARKPGPKVLPFDVDGCRIETSQLDIEAARVPQPQFNSPTGKIYGMKTGEGRNGETFDLSKGRWPANVVHDGSEEVLESLPTNADGFSKNSNRNGYSGNKIYGGRNADTKDVGYGGGGSVARFFYCAKASTKERDEGLDGLPIHERPGVHDDDNYDWNNGDPRGHCKPAAPRRNDHPTVKPIALIRWLVRLITPPNGLVLDPFMGSGTTGKAALKESFRFVGCENDREHGYFAIAQARIKAALNDA